MSLCMVEYKKKVVKKIWLRITTKAEFKQKLLDGFNNPVLLGRHVVVVVVSKAPVCTPGRGLQMRMLQQRG